MWDLYLRLDIVWRDGLSHLIVENDSKVLINMVTNKCSIKRNTPLPIHRIQEFTKKDWQIRFVHAWRKDNRSADWLANFSLTSTSWNLVIMEPPPNELRHAWIRWFNSFVFFWGGLRPSIVLKKIPQRLIHIHTHPQDIVYLWSCIN
jgi:hypothetical protein